MELVDKLEMSDNEAGGISTATYRPSETTEPLTRPGAVRFLCATSTVHAIFAPVGRIGKIE